MQNALTPPGDHSYGGDEPDACMDAGKVQGSQVALRQRLILWVRWVLSDFLVPLLRAHFYCTESEVYRQDVFYYRCFTLCKKSRLSDQSMHRLALGTEGCMHGCQKPEDAMKLCEAGLSL